MKASRLFAFTAVGFPPLSTFAASDSVVTILDRAASVAGVDGSRTLRIEHVLVNLESRFLEPGIPFTPASLEVVVEANNRAKIALVDWSIVNNGDSGSRNPQNTLLDDWISL